MEFVCCQTIITNPPLDSFHQPEATQSATTHNRPIFLKPFYSEHLLKRPVKYLNATSSKNHTPHQQTYDRTPDGSPPGFGASPSEILRTTEQNNQPQRQANAKVPDVEISWERKLNGRKATNRVSFNNMHELLNDSSRQRPYWMMQIYGNEVGLVVRTSGGVVYVIGTGCRVLRLVANIL